MASQKVLIVDDQTLLRQLLAAALKHDDRFKVVGESGNGDEAVEIALKLKPDLIVLDAYMPGMSGVEVLVVLREKLPQAKFLMISGNENPALVQKLVGMGVLGILEKSAPLEQFKEAMVRVVDGDRYYGSAIQKILQESDAHGQLISDREREVLQWIDLGYSTKQIAVEMNITFKTADNHRSNLMRKMGAHDVVTLLSKARKIGFLEPVK